MINESLGLFPIESCLFVIEVKSTLSKTSLWNSHINALEIENTFAYAHQPPNLHKTRYLLFAFKSNRTSKSKQQRYLTECSRYQSLYALDNNIIRQYDSGKLCPPIRALCVVDKEYSHEHEGTWTGINSDGEQGEVLIFIGGIINKYREIADTRTPIWMEDYIFPRNTLFQPMAP